MRTATIDEHRLAARINLVKAKASLAMVALNRPKRSRSLSLRTKFYTDYRSVKEIGFCVAEKVFGEPNYGPAQAPLVLFYPPIPQ